MNESVDAQAGLRNSLLRIARAIEANEGTEQECVALVAEWNRLCPHPAGSDIIFWPDEAGLYNPDDPSSFEMTPEEMVDFAMSWRPRVVAMEVTQRSGGESCGFYEYSLAAPDTPRTHIVTNLQGTYEKGCILAVALKGVVMPDGTCVQETFDYRIYSCGRILGVCTQPAGTLLNLEDWQGAK